MLFTVLGPVGVQVGGRRISLAQRHERTALAVLVAADGDVVSADRLGWHRDQFGTAPGYLGARVLEDAGRPGRHVIEVNFSSEQEARENNDRPETAEWAGVLRSLGTVTDDAYRNFREVGVTGDSALTWPSGEEGCRRAGCRADWCHDQDIDRCLGPGTAEGGWSGGKQAGGGDGGRGP